MSSLTGSANVLVADDAEFMRTVLKDIINSHGLASKIFEAENGIEAVRSYQVNRQDLVTMDINMPGADGVQALRAIMKINQKAKVVMVTAVEQKEIVHETMKLGARDYIVKPFDRAQVGITLNKVLRLR